MKVIYLIIALLIFGSCGHDYEVEVESNTEWSGEFGKLLISSDREAILGSGDMMIDVSGDNTVADRYAKATKLTEDGYIVLRLWKRPKGLSALFGDDMLDESRTTIPFGIVEVSGQ